MTLLRTLFLGLIALVVAASDIAQLGLIALMMNYRELSGESQGYAGMGLIKMMLLALPLIVPGALTALIVTIVMMRKQRAGWMLVFFAVSTLLSLIFIAACVSIA